MDIAPSVIRMVAERAGIDAAQISRDTVLADLDIESLDRIELVFDLEERFGIEIPYNANEPTGDGFTTVGDLIDAITGLVAEKK